MQERNVQLPVVSRKILKGDKYFGQAWLSKILEAPDNVRDRVYLAYHFLTGLRVSDVVGTEIVHIDWDNFRTYTYDHKKDEWRYVYWPERVKPLLKMWLKDRQRLDIKSKLLFPFSQKTANRIIKRWSTAIGFPHANVVSSHWCRHTFIRLSRRAGRDIKAVQQNTGDTVKTLLEWYSDLSREDMREEIESKPLLG